MTSDPNETAKIGRRRIAVLVPLAVFLSLVLLFLFRLYSGDPALIPSALIGHPVPQTNLPPVAGLERDGAQVPGVDPASFKDTVTVVNVWASWCVPCHDEAPLLMQLAQDNRVRLIGSAPYEALLLPDTAIATDQSRKIVFVVKDDDTVEARAVTLGPLDEGLRVIRDGLKPEDKVIVNGLQRARVGAKVTPQTAPAGSKS